MQILTLRKGFEAFECKFEQFERNSKHSNANSNLRTGFEAFECKFEIFDWDSKRLNANSNTLKAIRST